MGADHSQPHCPCSHVLVLLSERSRNSSLVEGVDHPLANHTVHLGSRYVSCSLSTSRVAPMVANAHQGFIYFATWDYYADEFGFNNLHIGKCEGELPAAITGCSILSSYLVLFISFYISTYRKPSSKSRQANGAKSVGKDQVVSASGRAAETLKSARSRFGHASLDMVESSTKGQWPATRE